MMFQIFLICYFGDRITESSSNLAFGIYDSDWLRWSIKNKKTMMFMLARFQKPIIFKAFKLYAFDLVSFSSVSF